MGRGVGIESAPPSASHQVGTLLVSHADVRSIMTSSLQDTIPVFPGELVRTNFTMLANGTWLLQFSVILSPEDERKQQPGRGNLHSVVQVDHPYMNPKLSWLHDDFNHTLVGACNEVYNLNPRPTDVPRPLNINITVAVAPGGGGRASRSSDVADADADADGGGVNSSGPIGWFSPWSVNEGLPQCQSGLHNISLTTTISPDGRSQTAVFTGV